MNVLSGAVWLLSALPLVAGQNSSDVTALALQESIVSSCKTLLFVMCCLFAGVFLYIGALRYRYPFTVSCFLFGVLAGVVEVHHVDLARQYTGVTRMNPDDLLLVFLPVLIFESSFNMDAHTFYRGVPQCLLLAVLGFMFCTALTAAMAYYGLPDYRWSWLTAVVFGSIVSATDPVAVVALLKEMKMSHTFTVLIEGESLLNDGVAIVLYELLSYHIVCETPFEAGQTLIELLKTCLGAPLLGHALAKATECILVRIYVGPVSELAVTLVCAYVTYFAAEKILGISAIVAVVMCGITLSANKMCISPESEDLVHTDWMFLSVCANNLIFMIVGMLVAVHFHQYFDKMDVWLILYTYLAITFFRSLMIAALFPVLRKIGFGMNWKEGVILSWGGLRGAIGLALSLKFAHDPQIQKRQENVDKVLIQVCGIIVLTLLLNANTVKSLMKLLNVKKMTLVKRLSMGNAIACLCALRDKSLRICRGDWRFMKADWGWDDGTTRLGDPYEGGFYHDDPNMSSLFVPYGTCHECLAALLPHSPSQEETAELGEEARKKTLRALKGNLWRQFRRGYLHRRSLRLLCVAADNASDVPGMYLKTEDVRTKFMKVSKLFHWLEIKLSSLMSKIEMKKKKPAHSEEEFRNFRGRCLRIYVSPWFARTVLAVILANVVQLSLDIYFAARGRHSGAVRYCGVFFVVAYAVEMFVKISALRWRQYVRSPWNKIDFGICLLAVVEGTVDALLSGSPGSHSYAAHARVLVVLRIFHFYLIGDFLMCVLSAIRSYVSSDLYYAYDIGLGFLFASEAVLKTIDVVVDFGPSATVPEAVYLKNVTEMLEVLDDFERKYPGIAVALKSSRAARSILNRARAVGDRLKRRSLIFEDEADEMNAILFEQIKELSFASRHGPFTQNMQNILEGVNWIHPQLAAILYENHVITSYSAGEVIKEAGEKHESVFIISKGILKISGTRPEEESPNEFQLPNTDSLRYFQCASNEHFEEYLTKGQTIGLLGFLQRTKLVTTAICERDCELIQVDYSFLEEAQKKFDDLIFLMWKSISVRIALQLLLKERRYKAWYTGDLHLRLQKAVLPDLTESTSLDVPKAVEDMVVIQGRLKDAVTAEVFRAPSYIPSSCRRLWIRGSINTRPRVIVLLMLKQKFNFYQCGNWVKPDKVEEMLLQTAEQEELESKRKKD